MKAPSLTRMVLCLALCVPGAAAADERFDHRGAVGLLVGGGGEYLSITVPGAQVSGPRFDLDLGGTFAIGDDGNELLLLTRAILGGPRLQGALILGYRGYFGTDQVKTYFDLGAAGHLMPEISAGPRVGFGVQLELSSLVGLYAGIAAQLALGTLLRFDGELCLGLQVRTYILE